MLSYLKFQIQMRQDKRSQSSFSQVKSKIKVVFLGQQSAGKTSILTRFIHDKFQQGIGPTIGIDFMAKNLHVGNNVLRMQLWDTAGQQRFRSLIPTYLKDALIVLIVFDLTNERSFNNLNQWIDLCQNNKNQKSITILLGNKSDLVEQRQVTREQIRLKIQQTSLPYFQVSAKTGKNVKQIFNYAGNEYFNIHLSGFEATFTLQYNEQIKKTQSLLENKLKTPQKDFLKEKSGKRSKNQQIQGSSDKKKVNLSSSPQNKPKEKKKCCQN